MTVAGKGGRPRKWRSDADRVRAYRARQRGDDEPPTVEIALVAGDEIAVAWDRVRELGETTKEQRAALTALTTELSRAKRALAQERTRFSWIEGDNDRLRTELERMTRHRDQLQGELDELRLSVPNIPDAPTPSPVSPVPNRAQRRRTERAGRRKPGTPR
jgi:chromosome segregation protein